jgi:hypothetical protein
VAVIRTGDTQKILNITPLGTLNGAASKTVKLRLVPGKRIMRLAARRLPRLRLLPDRRLIRIKPCGNLGRASSKNVKLKLGPGKDYSVGTNTALKVKILAGQ